MACNDPDNGSFVGRVCQIHLPDGALELTADAWNIVSFGGCPKLRIIQNMSRPVGIVLAGKSWPIRRTIYGYGNWCWNGYVMGLETAADFLVWLHGRRLFSADGAWIGPFGAWECDAPLDRAVIHREIASLAGRA